MPEIKRLDLNPMNGILGGRQIPSAFHSILKIHELFSGGRFPVQKVVKRVDFLFHDFRASVSDCKDFLEGASALNDFLFVKNQFKVVEDLYGEDSPFFAKVIEQRAGPSIAITLLYRELARKMNLGAVDLVSLPPANSLTGSLAVKVFFNGQFFVVSPGERGRLLSMAGASLEVPSELEVIGRFLRKLKSHYLARRDWTRGLAVLDLLVSAKTEILSEVKERGLLLYKLGFLEEAHQDLKRYVAQSEPSQDTDDLRKLLTHL